MAKPTWISTQSPHCRCSSSSRPMLIVRPTPLTSTRARCSWSRSSTTCPGMPRHMSTLLVALLVVAQPLGHDGHLHPYVGLHLQQEDPRRFEPEVPHIERLLA